VFVVSIIIDTIVVVGWSAHPLLISVNVSVLIVLIIPLSVLLVDGLTLVIDCILEVLLSSDAMVPLVALMSERSLDVDELIAFVWFSVLGKVTVVISQEAEK
jgi:hypothetical protein